ncbi:hypothetical protein IscW_ISCW004821 [Ixodes scapularis]|uniref:Uncharacterized protein n=1 Tax=Ixodes scapularis TaxID=6945 RepID=B7PHC2_IXOSC|nr:hypothetical protein IscW_ISCW004821 [Ixodes scapularis]|eukprot:XP_002402505.1 hypothetical protein IscW_ISCW004821 [Ixodes scapularis]
MTFKEQRLPRCKAGASLIKYKPVFSYDSKFFLVPSGRSVKVFSCSSGECVRTFGKHAAEVVAVVRNPENHVQRLGADSAGFSLQGAGWCRLETCPAGDDEKSRVLVDKVSLGGASPVAFGGPSCGLYAAIHKARLFVGDCTAPASPLKK